MQPALMRARETVAAYPHGAAAARVAGAYLGVVLLAVLALGLDVLLGSGGADSGAGSRTVVLAVLTLPGSLLLLGALSVLGQRPAELGASGLAYYAAELALLLAVGAAQAWLLWRAGRGPRYA